MFGLMRTDKVRDLKDKGSALLAKGKVEGALEQFQKAVRLQPDDVAARKKLAETLAKVGRTKESVAEYQQLVGRYAAEGRLVQAIALCKVILQLEPSHRETQDAIARLYSRKDAPKKEQLPSSMSGALVAPQPEALAENEGEGLEIEIKPAVPVEIDTAALPDSPPFTDLPREVFLALMDGVELRSFTEGQVVVAEGERGTAMYVVAQGSVKVVRHLGKPDEKVVDEMGEGTFFGEIGMLADVPRLASIVAVGECQVLEVSREMAARLGEKYPQLTPVLRRFYKARLLANLMRSSPLFAGLDEARRKEVVDRFEPRAVDAGTTLLTQGARGDGLYLLLRGRCAVSQKAADGSEQSLPEMGEGSIFGEISLLKNAEVTATVKTLAPSLLLTLSREAFNQHLLSSPDAARQLEALSAERLSRSRQVAAEEFEIEIDLV